MPNFQGAVNSMLATGAKAARDITALKSLNPDIRAEREAQSSEEEGRALEAAYGKAVEAAKKIIDDPTISDTSPERENAEATYKDYNKRMTDAASRALSANPTAERAKKLVELRGSEIRGESYIKGASADALQRRVENEANEEERQKEEALARGEDPDTGEPMYVSRDESRMASSNQRAQKQVRAKGSQKRRFSDYLAKMSTSMGGTVGDLPKEMQRAIASQYSPKERKKIMDEEDRKGGKK